MNFHEWRILRKVKYEKRISINRLWFKWQDIPIKIFRQITHMNMAKSNNFSHTKSVFNVNHKIKFSQHLPVTKDHQRDDTTVCMNHTHQIVVDGKIHFRLFFLLS